MRILIVGGVAGGASAAARARRLSETAEIVLFERGEHISFANCGLPYHIGGTIEDRDRLLVQTPKAMRRRFNIDVHTNTEVVSIDRKAKSVVARDTRTGEEKRQAYDFLVLSPGADPVRPPIPGIDSERVFTLRNLADMDAIKAVVDARPTRRALVIGGGYIGLEMAEALREKNLAVMLVELSPQVMGPADPEMAAYLHQELTMAGVDLRLGTSVNAFREEGDTLAVELSTGEKQSFDFAVMAIGVKPEAKLARDAGLALGERGGIKVNENMLTSDPAIYAVGDAVEVTDFVTDTAALIPLAGPANRQGRIAANNIFGLQSEYRKTQGTAVCKVFGLTVGMTGTNEKILKRMGRKYDKVYIHPANHASYYPGATTLTMKLLFDPKDGRILGAQAVGFSGVDKRIDVVAVALRAGFTVFDLEDTELCYAPPYGSAKDPVNYLGFIAANILNGHARQCHVEEILRPAADQTVLDVRTGAETEAGMIPAAVNIPVDSLRSKLDSLDKSKEYLVYCKVGLRGYLACRILTQNGFRCKNLSGGYMTYLAVSGLLTAPDKSELKDDTGETGAVGRPAARPESKICINACGLQCPGPIMKLKTEISALDDGAALEVSATDPGFASDVKAWCRSTGNELLSVKHGNGQYVAEIVKRTGTSTASAVSGRDRAMAKHKTIVVFSNDFDRAMAAFIIANGAAAMGSEVTLFFTFWGLNILRKDSPVAVKKTFIERMLSMMMPRGPEKLALSQMNMAGMGGRMIRGIMRKKNVASLPELIKTAQDSGVRMVACAMSMDLMGIKQEELIAGVEAGGVAMYLEKAGEGNVNLFI